MLTGKKVCLSALTTADGDALFEWINTSDLVRLSAPYRPVHSTAHTEWFESVARDPSRVIFAIRTLPARDLVGTVQLANIHPIHRHAEMMVRIGSPDHQGKGFGTEALKLLLNFAWRDLNLRRVTAQVFATNARAIASYRKAGFIEEGRIRDGAFIDGAWTDVIIMGAVNPTA